MENLLLEILFKIEWIQIFNTYKKSVLQYTERSITNILLSGTHSLAEGNWKIDWKLSPTRSSIQDKDDRTTAI